MSGPSRMRPTRGPGPLRRQLIISVAVVHALMMSLFLWDSTVRQSGLLLENQTVQTIATSQALANSAAEWIAAADVAGLQELVDSQNRFPELHFAMLTDRSGFVLAHTDHAIVGRYLQDLPTTPQQTIFHRSPELVDVAVPALVGSTVVGWARVGLGQRDAASRLSRLIFLGVAYAIAAIVIGSIVAWLLGRRMTRRLYSLMETIGSVKSGNRTVRSVLKGKDEVASLSNEFNAMLDQLEERDTALRRSEENYRSLMENIPVAIIVHDSDTRVRLSNPMASTLLDLTEEQLLGRGAADPVWRFLREDATTLPADEHPVLRVLKTGRPVRDLILGLQREDSPNLVWVLVQADPVFTAGAELREVVVTYFDITERKGFETLLRQSAEQIRDLYDHAPCGYHSLDQNGGFVQINDTELSWMGYRREEVIDRMAFPDWLTPESLKTFEKNFPRFKATGTLRNVEFELVRRDGSLLPVVVNSTAIYDESGRYVMSRSVVNDVSDRKQADAELKRLTLRTEKILNSAGEGIYGCDLEGRIVFLNQAAQDILGFTEADAIGQSSHHLFHHTKTDGTPYPEEDCPLRQALRLGKSCRVTDDCFWSRDGRKIPVEHVNSPLVDDQTVIGAVVVFRDVTEAKRATEEIRSLNENLEMRVQAGIADLKASQAALMNIVEDLNEKTSELEQANEKLKDLDRLKSMFIAAMSHELRTPLNSVIGFSTILLNEWTGPMTGEQKDILGTILRSGRHLLALITDVIDVSKIEAGKLASSPEDFDAYDAGLEVVSTFAQEAKKKSLSLEFKGIHQPVHADRRRVLQCLLNLVSNALKYTDSGRVDVEVAMGEGPSVLEFRVTDTGIGIGPQDLETLFTPFVRIILPQRPVVPGTGLGLYLSRKLAQEVLGGDITVQSTPGQGSQFVLRIPLNLRDRKVE